MTRYQIFTLVMIIYQKHFLPSVYKHKIPLFISLFEIIAIEYFLKSISPSLRALHLYLHLVHYNMLFLNGMEKYIHPIEK